MEATAQKSTKARLVLPAFPSRKSDSSSRNGQPLSTDPQQETQASQPLKPDHTSSNQQLNALLESRRRSKTVGSQSTSLLPRSAQTSRSTSALPPEQVKHSKREEKQESIDTKTLLQDLYFFEDKNEIEKNLNLLVSHAHGAQEENIFCELEKIALNWVIQQRTDDANTIFIQLNTKFPNRITEWEQQTNNLTSFEGDCRDDLMDAKKKPESDRIALILMYRDNVQKFLAWNRPKHALAILNQLIKCGCVPRDDMRASANVDLMRGSKELFLKDEVERTCDCLISHAHQIQPQQAYKIFHALEKIATEWALVEQIDFARIVFSQMNASFPKNMNVGHLQNNRIEGFEKDCIAILKDAKSKSVAEFKPPKERTVNDIQDAKRKQQAELNSVILNYKEKAQEFLLLGRPQYALIILKQLIECQCVPTDNAEATTYIALIEQTKTRSQVYDSLASWATDGGRTASLYAHALIVLTQNRPDNVTTAVSYFKRAAEAKYAPAIQAVFYLNTVYSNQLPKQLPQGESTKLAIQIAIKAGFDLGFNQSGIYRFVDK